MVFPRDFLSLRGCACSISASCGHSGIGFCILHDCNLVSESNSSAIFNVNILYLPSLFSFVHSVRGSTILVAMSGFFLGYDAMGTILAGPSSHTARGSCRRLNFEIN